MHKGRELDDDKTLAELGVTEVGAEIITVRKVLVARRMENHARRRRGL